MAEARKKMNYWLPFNIWYRKYVEETGNRPGVHEMKSWYDEHAATAWGEGRPVPSWEETKKHSKGMRRLEDIPDYFRNYRRKRKVMAFANQGGDHSDMDTAGQGSDESGSATPVKRQNVDDGRHRQIPAQEESPHPSLSVPSQAGPPNRLVPSRQGFSRPHSLRFQQRQEQERRQQEQEQEQELRQQVRDRQAASQGPRLALVSRQPGQGVMSRPQALLMQDMSQATSSGLDPYRPRASHPMQARPQAVAQLQQQQQQQIVRQLRAHPQDPNAVVYEVVSRRHRMPLQHGRQAQHRSAVLRSYAHAGGPQAMHAYYGSVGGRQAAALQHMQQMQQAVAPMAMVASSNGNAAYESTAYMLVQGADGQLEYQPVSSAPSAATGGYMASAGGELVAMPSGVVMVNATAPGAPVVQTEYSYLTGEDAYVGPTTITYLTSAPNQPAQMLRRGGSDGAWNLMRGGGRMSGAQLMHVPGQPPVYMPHPQRQQREPRARVVYEEGDENRVSGAVQRAGAPAAAALDDQPAAPHAASADGTVAAVQHPQHSQQQTAHAHGTRSMTKRAVSSQPSQPLSTTALPGTDGLGPGDVLAPMPGSSAGGAARSKDTAAGPDECVSSGGGGHASTREKPASTATAIAAPAGGAAAGDEPCDVPPSDTVLIQLGGGKQVRGTLKVMPDGSFMVVPLPEVHEAPPGPAAAAGARRRRAAPAPAALAAPLEASGDAGAAAGGGGAGCSSGGTVQPSWPVGGTAGTAPTAAATGVTSDSQQPSRGSCGSGGSRRDSFESPRQMAGNAGAADAGAAHEPMSASPSLDEVEADSCLPTAFLAAGVQASIGAGMAAADSATGATSRKASSCRSGEGRAAAARVSDETDIDRAAAQALIEMVGGGRAFHGSLSTADTLAHALRSQRISGGALFNGSSWKP